MDQSPNPPLPPVRARPGPKPRPPIRGEDLFGHKYVRSLQAHLARLRAAHPHPNRTLFYDDVAVAYLLAFFTPTLRSLRTIEDFSQTDQMRENLSVDRVPRSTLSDANKVFDPTLLEPIIEELRARLPQLRQADPELEELTDRIRAVDGSLFTVTADVAWALRQRRANGKPKHILRLNLQWATAIGVPEGICITGAGISESQVLMANLEPGLIYIMDRGYVCFELLDRILHARGDFVLRLKSNNLFVADKERTLSKADHDAGILSDRIGHLSGTAWGLPPPKGLLREVRLIDPDHPDREIRLVTSILDVPAHIIGAIYRRRWQIELFFRWLKVHAHFEHLTSHSKNGVTTSFYIAVIAVLLIYLHTQRPVNKYAYAMLSLVAGGRATMEEITPILERRNRECELDRLRRARKRAEKTSK